MKLSLLLTALLILSGAPAALADSQILSYWNFNNGAVGSEKGLGTWNTEPGMFGERFDADEKRLYSNKEGGTIFNSDDIYIDMSGLSGAYGKTWGVFVDSKINRPTGDTSDGGSFVAMAQNANNGITFVLSTLGYKNLEISYAARESAAAVVQWAWSTDNSKYTDFDEQTGEGVFHPATINLSGPGGKGLTQIDNQKTVYLRATFLFPSGRKGSVAFDNFQLTGAPVK